MVKISRASDFIVWGGVGILLVAPVRTDAGWSIGVLTGAEALAGLSNEGVVTIAALFVVAAGLADTGAMNGFVRRMMGRGGSLLTAQNRLLWPTAFLSGILNNTPLVAMLLPVTHDWAKRNGIS
ncbi:MAG: SLC13 family permease, partial [Gammaproteobacteria bacterium]